MNIRLIIGLVVLVGFAIPILCAEPDNITGTADKQSSSPLYDVAFAITGMT